MLKTNNKKRKDSFEKTVLRPSCRPKQKSFREDISIERFLMWAYQNQCAAQIVGRGVGLFDAEKDADGIQYKNIAGDGTHSIHRDGTLGARIDNSRFSGGDIHPDAELVHDLIMGRNYKAADRGLLIHYGQTGIVPDWLPGAKPRLKPKLRANGKPLMFYRDSARTKPVGCFLEIENAPEHIEYCRSVYLYWYEMLEKLCEDLWAADVAVTSFNILKPSVKKMPWM